MNKGMILVVDDTEGVRNLVEIYLEMAGYETRSFSNGEEALRHLETDRAKFVAVLTDMEMAPHIDGDVLARRIKAKYPDLPVVFMSGRDRTALVKLGLIQEDSPYLRKPFDSAGEFPEAFEMLAKLKPASST